MRWLTESQAWRELAEQVSNVHQSSAYLCWWLESQRYPYKDPEIYSLPNVSKSIKSKMLLRLKPHFAAKGIAGVVDRLDGEAYILGPRMLFCLLMASECDDVIECLNGQ